MNLPSPQPQVPMDGTAVLAFSPILMQTESVHGPSMETQTPVDDLETMELDSTDTLLDELISEAHATPKRWLASSGMDSDGDNSDSREGRAAEKYQRKHLKVGLKSGSSWAYQKSLNTKAVNPSFRPNNNALKAFRNKILHNELFADPHAKFQDGNTCAVRCSSCAEWVRMRALYDTLRWDEHRRSQKCKKRQAGGLVSTSLFQFFKPKPSSPATPVTSKPQVITVPCPGLAHDSDGKIDQYLRQVSATSDGGAPLHAKIVKELWPSSNAPWRELNPKQQHMVLCREEQSFQWRIVRGAVGAVFSTSCK